MVASRSAWSAGLHSTSVWRRLLTLALIEASGVRRSWLTAASSAVRIRLPSASASAWEACTRSRSRSRAAAAWAPNPDSWAVVAGLVWPLVSRARPGRGWIRAPSVPATVPVPGPPLTATRTQRPALSSCSSA